MSVLNRIQPTLLKLTLNHLLINNLNFNVMNRLEIEKLLEKNMKRHLSNKVLHAHPSPALWRPQFDEVTTHAKLTTNEGSRTKVRRIPYKS